MLNVKNCDASRIKTSSKKIMVNIPNHQCLSGPKCDILTATMIIENVLGPFSLSMKMNVLFLTFVEIFELPQIDKMVDTI